MAGNANKKTSDSQIRANAKYDKDNIVNIHIKLNKNTDTDILQRLSEVGAKQTYIKKLIRKDIEENEGAQE